MINKFYKITHKHSNFFRFIFFLRYVLAISFIFIALFLTIPNFFNYNKKAEIITSNLFKNYKFQIEKYEKIEFEALPIPKIKFQNVKIIDKTSSIKIDAKNLSRYPKLASIYNYQNFLTNKIILQDSNILLDVRELKLLRKKLLKKKKITF